MWRPSMAKEASLRLLSFSFLGECCCELYGACKAVQPAWHGASREALMFHSVPLCLVFGIRACLQGQLLQIMLVPGRQGSSRDDTETLAHTRPALENRCPNEAAEKLLLPLASTSHSRGGHAERVAMLQAGTLARTAQMQACCQGIVPPWSLDRCQHAFSAFHTVGKAPGDLGGYGSGRTGSCRPFAVTLTLHVPQRNPFLPVLSWDL